MHWLNHKLRTERNQLLNGGTFVNKDRTRKKIIVGSREIEKEFLKYGIDFKDFEKIYKQEFDFSKFNDSEVLIELSDMYRHIKDLIDLKNKKIKDTKNKLLKILSNKVESNIQSNGKHHIRTLNENQVSKKNTISVFDSAFTRMIGIEPDSFSEDFMVVQVYYFDIVKDLIYYGFNYKNEKYVYFTSSAGQIRTKKCVFVKESVWNKYEKTIMCGLTIDEINKKGGNNPNY